MSALDFRNEIELTIAKSWGKARENTLVFLKNNLPRGIGGTFSDGTPRFSGTLGNYEDYGVPGASVAGAKLYATGALRDSYMLVYDSGYDFLGSGGTKFMHFAPVGYPASYAYYYANGRRNSGTYHGFDFIAATVRDIERHAAEW